MALLDVQMVSIRVARVTFATHRAATRDGAQCDRPPGAKCVTSACLSTAMLLAIVLGACKKAPAPAPQAPEVSVVTAHRAFGYNSVVSKGAAGSHR